MKVCIKDATWELVQMEVKCEVLEWVKRNTLMWFSHIEIESMKSD